MVFWVRDPLQSTVKPVGCSLGTWERFLHSSHRPFLTTSLTLPAMIMDLPIVPEVKNDTNIGWLSWIVATSDIFLRGRAPWKFSGSLALGFLPVHFCCCSMQTIIPFQHSFELRYLAYECNLSKVKTFSWEHPGCFPTFHRVDTCLRNFPETICRWDSQHSTLSLSQW